MELLISLSKGFLSSSGLLIAIGAQNAFVIKQGLKRQHLLLTASICSLIDAVLITFGVLGFGYYVVEYPLIIGFTKYFAVLFLFLYGVMSLRAALKKQPLKTLVNHSPADSVKKNCIVFGSFKFIKPTCLSGYSHLAGEYCVATTNARTAVFCFGCHLRIICMVF